ncbi:unnamed protein product [Effrenium voratum]|uniref:Uncharacterized protein n=1 Tax=Effrenium voratum TaxID=2562239 RepID=A0AA36JLY8_9DINO|nr:unnamed protein product [Effrenium voratum]CAJ1460861.1 unnamed protein product [Effrenium voratum]
MVNAVDNNDNNETNEGNEPEVPVTEEVEGVKARLPTQLSRLPTDKLLKVHQALVELQEAGLSEVPDLSSLSKVVKKKTAASDTAKLPDQEHTSEYMGMSLWAWTPKRWFESIKSMDKLAGAKSEESGNNEGDQVPAIEDTVQANFERRVAKFETLNDAKVVDSEKINIEKLRAWYAVMKQADAELRSMATMDGKTSGDGCGVLFEQMPPASGPRLLPKVKVGGTQRDTGRGFSSGAGLKANPAQSVISVHLGGGGCKAAKSCWQHYFAEHQLDSNGKGEFYGSSNTLFASSTTGRYIPRAVIAGYDSEQVDAVSQTGMFAPTSILTGNKPGTSWNDGQGDSAFLEEITECVRRQMEQADWVEGFVFNHDASEDLCTNAMTGKLMSSLSVDYGKKNKLSFSCVPDCMQEGSDFQKGTAGLMADSFIEYMDLVAFYDRTSLKKMATSKVNGLGISSPDETSENSLLARLVGGVLGPMRFSRAVTAYEGSRTSALGSYLTNLTCYPRIHFVVPALGGVVAQGMEDFSIGKPGENAGAEAATAALRRGALSQSTRQRNETKLIAYSMFCRGLEQSGAVAKVADIKTDRAFQFVDWCPTGFSIFSYHDPKAQAPEVAVLENSTAAAKVFQSFQSAMDNVRSELESQVEGGQLSEMQENLAVLCRDYEEVSAETCGDEEEEEDGEDY